MLNADGEPYRLFDVENDPNELNDLVERQEHRELVGDLKNRLLERKERTA